MGNFLKRQDLCQNRLSEQCGVGNDKNVASFHIIEVCLNDTFDLRMPRPFTVIAVLTDDARSLRDQEQAAGRAVIDVLGHLRRDLARKVGTDAGDERGRDHGPGLKDVGRCRRRDTIRRDGLPVHGSIEESRVPVLRRGLSAEAKTGTLDGVALGLPALLRAVARTLKEAKPAPAIPDRLGGDSAAS